MRQHARVGCKRKFRNASYVVLVLGLAWNAFGGDVVVISTAGRSQGLLREHGGRCFVVTVAHGLVPEQISGVIGSDGRLVPAEIRRLVAPDLAVLEINFNEGNGTPCSESTWTPVQSLDDILTGADRAVLRRRDESGAILQVPVDIRFVDPSRIGVSTSGDFDRLTMGMSGSSLLVSGTVAGLLVSSTGRDGVVLRLDYVEALFESFFGWRVGCQSGCEKVLGDSDRARLYKYGFEREEVYRLPSGWPSPPFLHLIFETEQLRRFFYPPEAVARCFLGICWNTTRDRPEHRVVVPERLREISLSMSDGPRADEVRVSVSTALNLTNYQGDLSQGGWDLSAGKAGIRATYSWGDELVTMQLMRPDEELLIRLRTGAVDPVDVRVERILEDDGENAEVSLKDESRGLKFLWEERRELRRQRDDLTREFERLAEEYSDHAVRAGGARAQCELCRSTFRCGRGRTLRVCVRAAEFDERSAEVERSLALKRTRLDSLEGSIQRIDRLLAVRAFLMSGS